MFRYVPPIGEPPRLHGYRRQRHQTYRRALVAFVATAALGWLSADLVFDLSAPFGLSGADRSVGLVLAALAGMLLVRGIFSVRRGKRAGYLVSSSGKRIRHRSYLPRWYRRPWWYLRAFVAFAAAAVLVWFNVDLLFSPSGSNSGLQVDRIVGFVLAAGSYIPLKSGIELVREKLELRSFEKTRDKQRFRSMGGNRDRILGILVGFITCAVLIWLSAELVYGPFILSGVLPVERRFGLVIGVASCVALGRGIALVSLARATR